MNYILRKPWQVPEHRDTPIDVYRNRKLHRREFLGSLGVAAAGIGLAGTLSGCGQPSLSELEQAGSVPPLPMAAGLYPARLNNAYEYGRPETERREVLQYTNFYEFSSSKDCWKLVGKFKPSPWSVEVTGLCNKPRTFDLDDIHREMQLEERHYRHRCVERWAMCVPWTGFPLADLLALVEPKAEAQYVTFETFSRPDEAPGIAADASSPWPYTEGLTIDEAMNELAFVATGLYGEPLAKQNGAPIRLVVPWKYGFKSIKSIVQIRLEAIQPATFWNTSWAAAYDFTANVNPKIPHPNWPQHREWMLGTKADYPTTVYNGYGELVGGLYA